MEVAKLDLQKKRESLEKKMQNICDYLDTLETKIKDSEGVGRDVFYVDESVVGAVGSGKEGDTVMVDNNDFDVDLLILKGEIEIELEDGKKVLLNKNNKHLHIPKQFKFKMTGVKGANAVIQRTEK